MTPSKEEARMLSALEHIAGEERQDHDSNCDCPPCTAWCALEAVATLLPQDSSGDARRLLKQAFEAIETGRSEPLYIIRDAIRNWLEDNPEAALSRQDRPEGVGDDSAAALVKAVREFGPNGEYVRVRLWPDGDWDVLDPKAASAPQVGEHGTALNAVDFALELTDGEVFEFLSAWREGDLAEWPEFHTWLAALRSQDRPAPPTPFFGPEHVRNLLRAKCGDNQEAWATANGMSPQYVSDVLNERRKPGAKILTALGLRRCDLCTFADMSDEEVAGFVPDRPAPDEPSINIKCERRGEGLIGSTNLSVIRVEREDDGSLTAVTDHWPCSAPDGWVLDPVFKFLLGEGELDGCWFGDKPWDQGAFWWRRHLRNVLSTPSSTLTPDADVRALAVRLEQVGYRDEDETCPVHSGYPLTYADLIRAARIIRASSPSPDLLKELVEALKQAALDLHEAAAQFSIIDKLDARGCSKLTREAARRADAAILKAQQPGESRDAADDPALGSRDDWRSQQGDRS